MQTTLPEILLDSSAFGRLGVTLGLGPDAGGGSAPTGLIIPLIEADWLDERQCCRHVQARVHGEAGTPAPDYRACPSYRAGGCAIAPDQPCAFHEPLTARVWQEARGWVPYRDGMLFVGERTAEEIAGLVAELGQGRTCL